MPTISANIETEQLVQEARMIALRKDQSLREWAGQILTAAISKASAAKSKKTGAAK